MPKPSITFEALGTHWSIEQLGNEPVDLEPVLLPIVRMFESDYSRFTDDSYVRVLNRTKRLVDPPRELIDMLLFAQTMYEVSGSVFNISITPSLTGAGYGKAHGEARINTTDLMGIVITDGEVTLAPDVEIDFGGFSKVQSDDSSRPHDIHPEQQDEPDITEQRRHIEHRTFEARKCVWRDARHDRKW